MYEITPKFLGKDCYVHPLNQINYQVKVDKKSPKKLLVSARVKNTALLCMLMLMIGYSSYALIVIRSSANPPMDQNSPEDIFTLGSYLSRDQYGDRPLFYGQAYTSQVKLVQDGNFCKPDMSEGAPINWLSPAVTYSVISNSESVLALSVNPTYFPLIHTTAAL